MAHAISLNDYAAAAQPNFVLARLWKALAGHRSYVALRDELAAMSDRDLSDIGLVRCDIRAVAHKAVYGR